MPDKHYAQMALLDALAERHISDAQTRGELTGLPGEGQPLPEEDNALVPEELRAAYRLLKNAGFVPVELGVHTEIRDIEILLKQAGSDDERLRLLTRLNWLLNRRGLGHNLNLQTDDHYFEQLSARLSRET